MEQGLTVQQQKELQRKERLTGLIAILTDKEKSKEFERGLTIQKIVKDAVPLCELRRTIGNKPVAQAIDIQLTRLVASMNLKWNLSDSQIQQIVEDLIDKFPNETVEDFIMIFKKARQNEFGEIYRLDSAVIFGWVEKYLDEKYQVLESILMKEKDEIYKPIEITPSSVDWHKKWLDEVKKINVDNSGNVIDDDYVKKYGKEDPVKVSSSAGYAYFEVRGIKIMACSQTHAEELVQRMLELGELEEDI
jgi:DNA primase large subunit